MSHLLRCGTGALLAVIISLTLIGNLFAQTAAKKKSQSKKVTQGLQFAMVHFKGGCFDMGDKSDKISSDESPVQNICVKDFEIGKYEVTQGQWRAVMDENPSSFSSCGEDCPVEMVSWDEAQEFIKRLNKKTRSNYRLPTEAEWEYAARSGGKREEWAGTSQEAELVDYAWYAANAGESPHPVGQKQPNKLGIYDMSGNVWEWVLDIYKPTANTATSTDDRTVTGSVSRGGGWKAAAKDVRVSNRFYSHPAAKYSNQGFRLARTKSK